MSTLGSPENLWDWHERLKPILLALKYYIVVESAESEFIGYKFGDPPTANLTMGRGCYKDKVYIQLIPDFRDQKFIVLYINTVEIRGSTHTTLNAKRQNVIFENAEAGFAWIVSHLNGQTPIEVEMFEGPSWIEEMDARK